MYWHLRTMRTEDALDTSPSQGLWTLRKLGGLERSHTDTGGHANSTLRHRITRKFHIIQERRTLRGELKGKHPVGAWNPSDCQHFQPSSRGIEPRRRGSEEEKNTERSKWEALWRSPVKSFIIATPTTRGHVHIHQKWITCGRIFQKQSWRCWRGTFSI